MVLRMRLMPDARQPPGLQVPLLQFRDDEPLMATVGGSA